MMMTIVLLMRCCRLLLCLAVLPLVVTLAGAQAAPDVTGRTLPAAAAELNRAGLELGDITFAEWQEGAAFAENTVSAQTLVENRVNVTVLQTYNMRLVYDDNDFTLVNMVDLDVEWALSIARLEFVAQNRLQGARPARFSGLEWRGWVSRNFVCLQLWSIDVAGADPTVADCPRAGISTWLDDLPPEQQFWNAASGAERFVVLHDGVRRASCPTAITQEHQTCLLYLPVGILPQDASQSTGYRYYAEDVAPYVFFRYSTDYLWVINRTANRWLPTGQVQLVNETRQQLGDPTGFIAVGAGSVGLLAPGQCALFVFDPAALQSLPPECSHHVATATAGTDGAFWRDGFSIASWIDQTERACPPPAAAGESICLLPR